MKRLFLAVIALLSFAACTENTDLQPAVEPTADFAATFAQTRTELDGTAVIWNENDLLTIFTKTSHNRQYKIKEMTADGRSATFGYVSYTGSDNTQIATNYAIYPYDATATLSAGVVTTTLAPEQNYNPENGTLSYALMAAASADNCFNFENATALMRFKVSVDENLPDTYTLNAIKVASANNKIAGEVTIDLNEAVKKAVVTENGMNEVVLTDINATITTEVHQFYLALPAASFADNDVTVTFVFEEGEKVFELPAFELTQSKIKTVVYNIKSGDDFIGNTPGIDDDEIEPKPVNNEIWYTSTDGEVVTPNTTDVFGANIVSNTYENGKGVITFDSDVTEIGETAFYNCSSLTSVTIPDSVTSIGDLAFSSCSSLTSVIIDNSVTSIGDYAFSSCSGLTSVIIGNSVTSIGYGAFHNCNSLTSVTIPDSVTSIGEHPFYGCSSLAEFNSKFASEDKRCLVIDGVLHSFAPAGLTEYTIPDSVTSIGNYAFYHCSSLTSITLPDRLTSIGDSTFSGCSSLTSITIPDSVTEIGKSAFRGCSSLTSITIPDSVISIGGYAFSGCSSLTSITIPNSVTEIGKSAFSGCSSLANITIPNSITSIGDSTFSGCSSLTSITIPNSVTSIGNYAFRYCSSLTSATIPDSVISIGGYAFSDCRSLTSVTIPNSVTSIGEAAFWICTSLESIYCKPTTPPTGGYSMFDSNTSGRMIYVPRESVDAYKAAYRWSEYKSSFVAYDFE